MTKQSLLMLDAYDIESDGMTKRLLRCERSDNMVVGLTLLTFGVPFCYYEEQYRVGGAGES